MNMEVGRLMAHDTHHSDTVAHVEFRDVCKSYDGKNLVVDTLNLSVQKGEFLTLLGPSGSGKTTSLMMLAGFENVSSGELFVQGAAIKDLPPYKRDIGVVFQNYALFPHMTVAENVAFPLNVRKVPQDQKRKMVGAALEMVRLSGFADRKPAKLSGGQQQRVALARALVFEPALVLLDEPLGALDRQLREQMQYELKRIHDELDVTMVYVTHDQSEALTMSDRIAVFNHGVVQHLGTPQELYNSPSNVFVASFIGENNFLPVSVTHYDGAVAVVSGADLQTAQVNTERRFAAGDAVTLALRPERIRVGAAVETCRNRIMGRILSTTFLGDQIRLSVETADGTNLIVKKAMLDTFSPPPAGEPITLGFQPEDAVLLPSGEVAEIAS